MGKLRALGRLKENGVRLAGYACDSTGFTYAVVLERKRVNSESDSLEKEVELRSDLEFLFGEDDGGFEVSPRRNPLRLGRG